MVQKLFAEKIEVAVAFWNPSQPAVQVSFKLELDSKMRLNMEEVLQRFNEISGQSISSPNACDFVMFEGARKSSRKIVSHDGLSNLCFQRDQKIYLIVTKKKQEYTKASLQMGMEDLCDLTQEELQEI